MRLMAQEHVLGDGKPEARTAGGRAAPFVDAVKALGEAGNMDGINAFAIVGHLDTSFTACLNAPAQHDGAAFGGIAYGIERKVGDSAAQFLLATEQTLLAFDFHLQRMATTRKRSGVFGNAHQ